MYSKSWIQKIFLGLMIILVGFLGFSVYASEKVMNQSDSIEVQSNLLDDTYLASNQFTQDDDLSLVTNFLDVPSSYLLVGESDSLLLYMEEESYAIRVVNKVDGFIYGSSISTKDDNLPNFNTTWEGIVNSAVTIKYYSYNETTGAYTSVEESFLKSNESTSSYESIDNGFIAHLYFGESGISLDLVVYINDDFLCVEIPNDSIQESTEYQLRSIKTYPFLGAVYSNSIPGYILVPDGSGALIRYQEIDVLTDIYEFRYYGQDNSVQAALTSEPTLSFPVSGMVLGINQHGFISIVEDGAVFASLVVSPAKNNLKYYYTYNEFLYRSLYQTPLSESQANSSSGRLVTEDQINSCNIAMKYQFLSGDNANYVGMANAYQEYLLSSNQVIDSVESSSNVDVFLEVIGSEIKSGFIFNEYLKMTTYEDLHEILTDLNESNVDMSVVYKGFTKNGVTSTGLKLSSISSKLGTKEELKALIDYASTLGIDLYLYTDPMSVYEDGSFNMYQDIASRINQNLLSSTGLTKNMYFASPSTVASSLLESLKVLQKEGMSLVAIGSLGNTLYSDHTDQMNPIDRGEAIQIYEDALNQSSATLVMYQSNLYTLKYSSSYLLMPISSSRYRIYSDSVPFTAYVLSGVLNKYSPFQNFTSSSRIELLKMVDYGVFPSYILTFETAYLFQDTELKQIYSSSYQTWKTKIISDYSFVKSALENVIDAHVTKREYKSSGVYKITYSNDVIIYVNYTSKNVLVDGLEISPLHYQVVMSDD